MKKTLQRVLAVVLSLVMVAGLVAIDSSAALAAKKLKKVSTGKKTVYSGQSRTFKISGTNAKKAKWTVSGTGKKYVKITGKKTGKTFKFKVKANATGKAKITAKLTKKNKVSYTYNLKCKATSMSLSNQDIYTNDVVTLTPAFAPSNAVAPAGDATYEVFSDADCTAAATTVVVTASGISAEFTATAPGTYYVRATVEGLDSAVAAITVTDKVAKLTSVQQTKKNELVVTVDAADPKLTPETLYIQDVNEQRFYVKSITADKADATKLTVVTLTNVANGKEITVSYAGSSQTFTATTGEVSKIELNVAEVPISTNVTVKAVTKDVNGVEIDEEKYGTSNEKFSTFDIVFRNSKGTTDSSEGTVNFDEVGEVADVTIKYNTGKVDANNEAQYIEFAGTIVGKAQAVITGIDAVRFYNRPGDNGGIENYVDTDNNTYEKLMANRAKYMQEKVRAESKYRLAVLVKDAEGFIRVNGSLTEAGYILSSADETTLLVEDDQITGVKGGKTQILASNDKGEVVFTIPVTVEDAPRLKTIKLSSNNGITLTTGNKALPSVRLSGTGSDNFKADSGSITVTGIDQYGDDYGTISVSVAPSSDKNYDDIVKIDEGKTITATVQEIAPSAVIAADRAIATTGAVGDQFIKPNQNKVNQYTITVTDGNDDGNKVTKGLSVTVKQPGEAKKLVLALDATERDTTVKDNKTESDANQTVDIKLAVTDSAGVHIGYVPLPSVAAITINGKAIANNASQAAVEGNGLAGATPYVGATATRGTVTKAGVTVYGGNVTSTAAVDATKVGPFKAAVSGAGIGSAHDHEDTFNDNIQFVTRGLAKACVDDKIVGTTVEPKTDWWIANKVNTGSYRVTVKGVKFKAGAGVDYAAKDTDTVAASFTVKDSQGSVTVTQDYNTTSDTIANTETAASAIALHTLRFTPTDAEEYTWNAADSTDSTALTYRVGFRKVSEANKGYKTTETQKMAFTRLVILVPYRDSYDSDLDYSATWTRGVYVPITVNANYSVTSE